VQANSLDQVRLHRMEDILAGLLRYGALFACFWLLCGWILGVLDETLPVFPGVVGQGCLILGISLLIALPVLRVAIMMLIFLLERDYRFAAISGAVLCILATGFLLGAVH
jgi:uncharacterized membrane protein